MAHTGPNRLDSPAPSGSHCNPQEQQKDKGWDGVERRRGEDRRRIAYLQNKDRRKSGNRRKSSKQK
ncbi:MAG: hypothetical protein ACYSSI_10550 [Planctomycetota bacterium]